MPSASLHVSRRHVLFGAAALALLGSASTACAAKTPPPDVSALTDQLERARADSLLATGAAATARPPVAGALTAIASQRTAHADALADEITRVTGQSPSTAPTTSTTTSTGSSTSAAPAPPAPTVDAARTALQQSADAAATAAAGQTGYAAGLLGSIAAACTAAATVALVGS